MKSKMFQIVILAAAVIFIGNLNAVVDSMLHPEISFFDKEHLIVGSISAVFMLALLILVEIFYNKQRKSELEHKLLKQNFDYFFNHAGDIIIISNEDLKIVDINNKAVSTYGYSREELLKLHVKNLRSLDSLGDFDRQRTIVEKQNELIFETMHIKKDGTVFPVEVSTRKIEVDGMKYYQSIVRDISERKKAERDLLLSNERFTAAFILSPVAMALYNPLDGHIVDVNNAFVELLGYSRQEILDHTAEDIRLFADPEAGEKILQTLKEKNSLDNYQIDLRRKSGEIITVLDSASLIEFSGVKHFLSTLLNISERKKTEEALRINEDRYRDLVENSFDLMCTHDLEGKILSANPAAFKSLGYESESFHDMNIKDILAPEYKNLFDAYLTTVRTKGLATGIMLIQSKTGEKRIWEYANSLRTEGVAEPIVRGIAHDITERYEAERDLRKSEEKFRSIVETTNEYIWEIDLQGNQLYCNPAVEKILGYKPEELIGKSMSEYFHPEERDEMQKKFAEYVTQKTGWQRWMLRWKHKEGGYRYLESNGAPFFDAKGTLIGFRGADRDVTERKQAEEQIRFQASVLDQVTNGVAAIDLKGKIIFWNHYAEILFGWKAEEVIGKAIFDFLIPENQKLHIQELIKLVFSENRAEAEISLKRKDGTEFPTHINYSLLRNSKGDPIGVVGIGTDISERKLAEERLKESEQRYREVIENAAEIIFTTDSTGHFTYVNPSGQKLSEYSLEELQSFRFTEIIAETDRRRVGAAYYRQWSSHTESTNLTFPIRAKSGKIVWISQNAHLLQERGEVRGFYVIARDITELKKAQDALSESEKKYRGIFENASEGIYQSTPEGKFIDVNPSLVNLLGYSSRQEFLSEINDIAHQLYVHPEQRNEMRRALVQKGHFQSDDICLYRKDKQIIYVSETSHCVSDPDGSILYYEGTIQDITQRKKAQEALRISEDKYRHIFNSAPVGIYQSDSAGNLLSVNDRLVQILGYSSKEELLEKHMAEDIYFDKNEREKLITKYEPVGSAADLEIRWKKKDGTPIWIQITSTAVKDSSGKTLFFDGFVRDISDRKKAEFEIMKLSDAVAQSPASILITDLNGNINYVNNTFEKVTGYSLEEVYMKNPRLLQSGLTPQERYKDLWNTILAGKTWRGELLNKRKNGELFWEDALICPVKDKDDNVINYLAVKQDITEKKKTLEELVAAKEQAEKSEKLKTEFLAQMSHEIRTPLNIITSNISFLQEEASQFLDEDSSSLFGGIELSSKRIIRTIDLILNMSELQTGSFRPMFEQVDLHKDILNPLIKEFSNFASLQGLELKYNVDSKRTKVFADSYCINQIFANLIDNALKYTKTGSIAVSLKNEPSTNLVVTVSDTGIGISKEFLARIFEPFTQEDQGYSRKFEGSGLGLSLVKKYCELNNAEIYVESEINVGSTFHVTFMI